MYAEGYLLSWNKARGHPWKSVDRSALKDCQGLRMQLPNSYGIPAEDTRIEGRCSCKNKQSRSVSVNPDLKVLSLHIGMTQSFVFREMTFLNGQIRVCS